MKLFLLVPMLVLLSMPCPAQQGSESSSEEFSQATDAKIEGWGRAVDPDQDCQFFRSRSTLIISTPASQNPHDFSPELSVTNAPRVVRSVTGDFSLEVRVDDRLHPGNTSTLDGRLGYHGAALVAIADEQNVVTLARAMFKAEGEEAVPYANFEIRANGTLLRMGLSGDHPLPKTGAVFLRLERRGAQITGSVSENGHDWSVVRSETLPDDWAAKMKVGVMAVNSSIRDFSPQFSMLRLSK